MTQTTYYGLQMDEPQDEYDVEVVNANLKKIDEQMKTRENVTDALQTPEFTVADKRENISSKEKLPKILGKIARFFMDLKAVAFSGSYNDLSDKPGAVTQSVNGLMSALDKKKLDGIATGANKTIVDSVLSQSSANPVQNKVVCDALDKKLSTANVANNNTTTQSGFALDARQANPNISGTMAASIAQLNNDSKNIKAYYGALIAGDNVVFRDSGYIYNSVYIANSMVILSFSLIVLAPLSTKQVIVSLPDFLKGKIEMNNFSAQSITGESLFLFSDNSDYIWVYFNDSQKLKIGDEIRVFGIGCLRSAIVSA